MWFRKKAPGPRPTRSIVAVRMEAIGGQGANSAGKILAEAAVLGMRFSGNHFSSFGSEKRGSPVRSFVRFSPARNPIRSASFIHRPDLLVIFHEALIATHPECLEGADEQTDVVINTEKRPHKVQLPVGTRIRSITTVDATALAAKEQCGLNAVMLGACSAQIPEIEAQRITESLQKFFAKLPAKALAANIEGFRAGARAASFGEFSESQSTIEESQATLPRLGWLNAPIGGLISNPGNTVLKDNSVSRKGIAPRFNPGLCISCGFCDMVCPDYCFVWEAKVDAAPSLKGIDYQYCKGCQKCISICPVEALTASAESDIPPDERQARLFPRNSGDDE